MEELNFIIGDIPAKRFCAEKADKAVLALHGFGGSKDSWAIKGLAQRLCPKGYDVVAIDWRCHGERQGEPSELTIENCVEDMRIAERWIAENISQQYAIFATSFGGFVTLNRLEMFPCNAQKVMLRVPAVSMPDSILRIAKLTDPDFTLEKAAETGCIRTMVGIDVPYSFYESIKERSCVRECRAWSEIPMAVVYARNDELVATEETEEFLRLNPAVRSMMVESGHRMAEEGQLDRALDYAMEFIVG